MTHDRFDEMAERVVPLTETDIHSGAAQAGAVALRHSIAATLRTAVAAETERCEMLVRALLNSMRLPIEVHAELDDVAIDISVGAQPPTQSTGAPPMTSEWLAGVVRYTEALECDEPMASRPAESGQAVEWRYDGDGGYYACTDTATIWVRVGRETISVRVAWPWTGDLDAAKAAAIEFARKLAK